MSGGAEARELEERLREAAALGDAEEVRRLLGAGADINSRNEINGWTCLHWACKRNHARVVSCLLDAGADKHILTAQGELPAQLTSKPDIRKILGVEDETECQGAEGLNQPVAASPLARPPLPSVSAAEGVPDSAAESPSDSASTSSASERDTSPCGRTPTAWCGEEDPPALGAAEPPPAAGAAPRRIGSPERPRGPGAPPGPARRPPEPAAPEPAAPQRPEGSPAGPVPGFQPFFFTGTFPCNMQELVLKVRVQNLRDNDFIEIELDRQELTYQDLLRVSCCELGVNPDQVEKIRKLPNTLVRKDKDVARLQDFQELELVLAHSDRSPFRGARPCSGSRAAELTY